MFKFLINKIQTNSRRVAVTETLDLRELQSQIQFHIRALQKTGHQYFTKSAVLQNMNEDIGWPVKSDDNSMEQFKLLFSKEVSKYQPSSSRRNAYSFQLKPASNHMILTKILRGN